MALSVMVREPGYQDGTAIGGWTCYLVAPYTPLTNNINLNWLGIIISLLCCTFHNIILYM